MNPTLAALALANFAVGTGALVIAGVLNQIAAGLQVSVAAAGQLMTAYALGYAVGAPVLSALAGRMDRRRVLALGLLLFVAGSAVAAAATGYGPLLAARCLMACGAALITPTSLAVAGFLSEPAQRGKAMSLVFGGFAIANVLGVPLGAWVGAHFGWRASLAMVAAFALLGLVAVQRCMPLGIKVPPTGFDTLFAAFTDWRKQLLILIVAVQMASIFVIYTYVAPLIEGELGAGAQTITALLFWFGAVAVVATFAAGQLIVKLGVPRVMAGSLALLVLAHVGLSLLGGSLAMAVIVFALWATAGFTMMPAQQTRLVNAAPHAANALLALNASALYAGQALGAFVGGRVVSAAGVQALGWVGAIIALLALGMFAGSLAAERALLAEASAR